MQRLRQFTALAGLLIAVLWSAAPVFAHAQLVSSSPAADSQLAAPPAQLVLTFSESIDLSGISVTAVDASGLAIKLGQPKLAPDNDRRLLVPADGISVGTYTVSWTNRSATDGHELSGSFAFRVGGSSVAPAAATVEGEHPAAWSVATRWITFLGLAPALGLLILAVNARRRLILRIGLALALIATVLEPLLLAWIPAGSNAGSSVRAAIEAQPNGWWVRLAGIVLTLAFAFLPDRDRRSRLIVAAAALVGLSGFALTGHAAGRENYSTIATAVSFLHNAAVGIWIGALALIVLAPAAERLPELRAFSRRALPLALLAVAAGILNAGLIFPSLKSITSSDYGRVLIGKVAIVVGIFALAGWHHLRVRSAQNMVPGQILQTMRVEIGLVIAAVLFASTMAMLAPPVESHGDIKLLDMAEPTSAELTNDQVFVRMTIDPAKTGKNALTAWATQGVPFSVVTDANGNTGTVNAPPLTDVQLIRVTFASITHPVAPLMVDLAATGDGRFAAEGLNLTVQDWWRVTVTVRRSGASQDLNAVMYLRLPDPNISTYQSAAASVKTSDADAQALFGKAHDQLANQPWAFYRQNIAGGNGGVDISTQTWSNGAIMIESPNIQLIRMNGQRYYRPVGGDWTQTDDSPPEGPASWLTELDGATDFQLGNVETMAGEQAQIVHFYVPSHNSLAPAFYTWWIGTTSGNVLQEAMVSRSHYMIQTYDWSAPPPQIVAPKIS